jgi:hypothetical protein
LSPKLSFQASARCSALLPAAGGAKFSTGTDTNTYLNIIFLINIFSSTDSKSTDFDNKSSLSMIYQVLGQNSL